MDPKELLALISASLTGPGPTAPRLVLAGAPPVPQTYHPEQPRRPRKRRGRRKKARSIYASRRAG